MWWSLLLNPSHLLAAAILFFGLQNLLLLRFLGVEAPVTLGAGLVLLGATALMAARLNIGEPRTHPSLARFISCSALALAVLMLAGEGRFFYSNYDWQVRDAVLNDMIRHPWPFAYLARGSAEILRAPIGMYLLPSIVGKLAGMPAADLFLLIQNSLIAGTLLTLVSMLFETKKSRLIALVVFLLFSGMDVLGQLLLDAAKVFAPVGHLESWAGVQFSSTLTLAFWVPQHALAGWFGAGLFMLWRRGLLPLGGFLAPMPLLALWSPLGVLGTVPFGLYAALITLANGKLRWFDVVLPALATLLSLHALVYLQAAGESVGLRWYPVSVLRYLVFQLLEIVPYLAAIWALSRGGRFGVATLTIVTSCLAVLPLLQIGENTDLTMRASIPSLTILIVMIADVLHDRGTERSPWHRLWRIVLIAALAVGAVTPLRELARAIVLRPTPYPLCSFFGAWDQSFSAFGKSTYLARVEAVPSLLRPENPHLVPPGDPANCWSRPWQVARSSGLASLAEQRWER